MTDICTAEIPAGRAVTVLVNRAWIGLITFIAKVHYAAPGKDRGMTCIAAGHYAVKHIHPTGNCLDYIRRRSHSHEITGLIYRHKRLNCLDYAIHILCRLADCKTAYSIAVKVESGYLFHVPYAYIVIG